MGVKLNLKPFCKSKKVLNDFTEYVLDYSELSWASDIHPSDRSDDFWRKITLVVDEEWEILPPTERQLRALNNMMVPHDTDLTRGEAARIIKDQLNRRAVG